MKSVLLNNANVQPSKIVCIGRNYVEHIKELNNEIPTEPVVFIKPNSSISNSIITNESDEIHFEGEMCFLVKDGAIYGIGFGLDLTKRNLQTVLKSKGLPWERAKSFDNSAVFSEFVTCEGNSEHYKMALFINDELRQFADYQLMIHKPDDLLTDIKQFLTLEDGDIIMTGTPKGVGVIHCGDKFTAQIIYQDSVLIEKSWLAQ